MNNKTYFDVQIPQIDDRTEQYVHPAVPCLRATGESDKGLEIVMTKVRDMSEKGRRTGDIRRE